MILYNDHPAHLRTKVVNDFIKKSSLKEEGNQGISDAYIANEDNTIQKRTDAELRRQP
jgi:hypothetical protein